MQFLEGYRKSFDAYLSSKIAVKEPEGLYAPMAYILQLGGKRLRPILSLLAAEICGGKKEDALSVALAIEVFHNFSLVHDDIMDDAPLRRGHTTVHEKWDVNTAILSGDAMLIASYRLLEDYDSTIFKSLLQVFSKTALEVCEGQQYDVDFEEREDVSISEYLKMIQFKTAVLLGAALKMGAITANASKEEQDILYEFGISLGMAFQLQDDYLDVYGKPETFGKQIGGDIIENKKTFLYLTTLELCNPKEAIELTQLYSLQPKDPSLKVQTVTEIMTESGAAEVSRVEIKTYTEKAFLLLEKLAVSKEKKESLLKFGVLLMDRTT